MSTTLLQAKPGAQLISDQRCFPREVVLTGTVASLGLLVTGTGTKFLNELTLDPNTIVQFPFATTDQGNWNASTNTPALIGSVGTEGYKYTVSVAGSTNLDGNFSWAVGDILAFYQGKWIRSTRYNRNSPIRYKYLYSTLNNELREIANINSDLQLTLKVAFTSVLAGETCKVAGINPVYRAISLNPTGAGCEIGTVDLPAMVMAEDVTINYEQEGGLKPICVDGTAADIQVTTQI